MVDSCHDIPEIKRIRVCKLSYSEDGVQRLGYMAATMTERTSLHHHFSRMPAELNDYTHQEINEMLEGYDGSIHDVQKTGPVSGTEWVSTENILRRASCESQG